jgi:hypothetical protein
MGPSDHCRVPGGSAAVEAYVPVRVKLGVQRPHRLDDRSEKRRVLFRRRVEERGHVPTGNKQGVPLADGERVTKGDDERRLPRDTRQEARRTGRASRS